MNRVSKLKVALGYFLLLALLLAALLLVHREMGRLVRSDEEDLQWTDSLTALLRKKDANTLQLLRTLSDLNAGMLSAEDLEQVIAEQDSAISLHRVQHRVIAHRDTVMTTQKKKGFLRRLGEVFVPPRKDSAMHVNTSLEYAVDTVIDAYNPADSLHRRLLDVARSKQVGTERAGRRSRDLKRMDRWLTARIDSVLADYEQENRLKTSREAAYRQSVRRRSVYIIGGVAAGAVLLSAFFMLLIGRDITRSNRYRRQIEEANRRAEELLALREKLMLAITHDFKAPLGSIMGYADLLSRLTVEEQQRFYLDNMKASSEHLLKLVTDLLEFHRLDQHKAEVHRVTFNPARLLEEIYVTFQPLAAAKGLAIHQEVAPGLDSTFISDPLRLRQIFSNLFSNAVKFTRQGSVSLTACYEEGRLVVAVADTGKGMDPSDKERIFQEFTRLPGAQGEEGFGLGLSIVRMLVRLLEGDICVESEPGKGSVFTVRVPLYPVTVRTEPVLSGEVEHRPEVMERTLPVSSSSLRVLLIDDDRLQLAFTAAMLQQSGISSVSCVQVDELLDALRTDRFDLLLTDVQMPAINGFDLLHLLRASNLPQARIVPVIAVTARSDMRREEFTAHGFAGCLHKPFTVAELLQEAGREEIRPVEGAESGLPEQTETSTGNCPYNFSALTAFSDNDPEAAHSILANFFHETRKHLDRLAHALDMHDMDELAAVAHKMIPLLTLIGADAMVASLTRLEASRNEAFTEELAAITREVLDEGELLLSYGE